MVDLKDGVRYPAGYADQWIEAGLWTDERPQLWLRRWAEETPDAPALIGPRGVIDYRDFHERALSCANGFLAADIRMGDTVGLQLPNGPEILIAYHALQMIGAVPCLLHMPYRAGELRPLLNHGAAKAVICWAGLEAYDAPGTMCGLRDKVPNLETVIVAGGPAPDGTMAFEALESAAPKEIEDPPSADDPCVLAFTSGTSAQPKAVVHSFRTLSASHRLLSSDCSIRQSDRVLSAPPFTHIYGMCVAGISLYAGASVVLMEMYSPAKFSEAMAEYRPTVMFCAPAHFLGSLQSGALTPDATSSLRTAVLAGAACPPEVFLQVEDAFKNAAVYQMFGMTEILMSMINPPNAPRDIRMTSVGTPPDGHELRVCDLDGKTLGPYAEGELEVRGAFVFAGYFNNDEANLATMREGGWFRTGDLAKIDQDGNVYLTGRVKDIINRGGIKINPIDVEALVDDHPKVQFSAIVPMPDPVLGEKACLFVQLTPGEIMALDDVCAYLAEQGVAKMKWPERLETIETMPMTPTRKIVKGELVKELEKRLAS